MEGATFIIPSATRNMSNPDPEPRTVTLQNRNRKLLPSPPRHRVSRADSLSLVPLQVCGRARSEAPLGSTTAEAPLQGYLAR